MNLCPLWPRYPRRGSGNGRRHTAARIPRAAMKLEPLTAAPRCRPCRTTCWPSWQLSHNEGLKLPPIVAKRSKFCPGLGFVGFLELHATALSTNNDTPSAIELTDFQTPACEETARKTTLDDVGRNICRVDGQFFHEARGQERSWQCPCRVQTDDITEQVPRRAFKYSLHTFDNADLFGAPVRFRPVGVTRLPPAGSLHACDETVKHEGQR